MTVIRKNTFTCHFLEDDREQQFPSCEAALGAAREFVGNNRFVKPFACDDTYLFGPGDGTTSVIVRQDFDTVTTQKPTEAK